MVDVATFRRLCAIASIILALIGAVMGIPFIVAAIVLLAIALLV